MKIRNDAEASTDSFWEDLSEGYLKPEDILENESDILKVKSAVLVLEKFYNACVEQIEGFLF